ncbi:MAG TPA: GNAT family N-acetyltransferase [Ktedonobacterales bacterium]|nr:GNAT family N-acetyltransferase [Ktedonobacterales bacterium]
MDIYIRPFASEDRPAILALLPRLLTGLAPWRDTGRWLESVRRSLGAAMDGGDPHSVLLVAADSADRLLGFISMTRTTNFSGEPRIYIDDIVVIPEAEGHGVARTLLGAAERHARSAGIRFLALDVNAGNARARAVYGHWGFVEESLHLVKVLDEKDATPLA